MNDGYLEIRAKQAIQDCNDAKNTIDELILEIERLEKELEEKEQEIERLETSCQEYSEEIERLTS